MRTFELYYGEISFPDGTGKKNRHVVILEISRNAKQITVFAVYSYRRWFNKEQSDKIFVEIKDLKVAGLKRKSFIEITNAYNLTKEQFRHFTLLGVLSEDDISTVIKELNKFLG